MNASSPLPPFQPSLNRLIFSADSLARVRLTQAEADAATQAIEAANLALRLIFDVHILRRPIATTKGGDLPMS